MAADVAIKRGTAPAAAPVDPDAVPEVPADIPRHGNPNDGRPKIRHVDDPTQMSYFTRASKFGEVIENHYLIHRAELRQVVYAMGRHDELVLESQAVAGLEDRADKDELVRIAHRAIERVGGRAAAARGTALHKLRERRDEGVDLAFVGPKTWQALETWSAMADCFTAHGSEQFVVCDRWQAAGTYDALWSPRWPMTAPDGTVLGPDDRLIVDLKSGKWGAEWFGPTYSVQLATYAHGTPYRHVSDEDVGRGLSGRHGWCTHADGCARCDDTWGTCICCDPRTDWALIPHVPIESPEDAGLWWVDLRQGAFLAELAADIRGARRLNGLFLPAELPAEPIVVPEQVGLLGLMAQLRNFTSPAELDGIYDAHAELWDEDCTRMVKARLRELEAS